MYTSAKPIDDGNDGIRRLLEIVERFVKPIRPTIRADEVRDYLIDQVLSRFDISDDSVDKVRNPPALLRSMMVSRRNRLYRRDERRQEILENEYSPPSPDRDPTPVDAVISDELIENIAPIYQGLPDSDQAILFAWIVIGSERSAAKHLKMTPGKYRYRLWKIIKRIQSTLK